MQKLRKPREDQTAGPKKTLITGTYFKPANWSAVHCGKCNMRVEYAEANCAGGRAFHPECFCCSVCNIRLTANQMQLEKAVHATVDEGSVEIFCTNCGAQQAAERGFIFDPYHTLSGPADTFGTKMTTTVATTMLPGIATHTNLLKTSSAGFTSRSTTAQQAGRPTLKSKACPQCASPHWVLHGMERAKCTSCGEIY